MYDKMNVPVKVLDLMLILLGTLIVFLFVFGIAEAFKGINSLKFRKNGTKTH